MIAIHQGLLGFLALTTLVLLSLPTIALRNHAGPLPDFHRGGPAIIAHRVAHPAGKKVAVSFGSQAKAISPFVDLSSVGDRHYKRTSDEPPEGPPEYKSAWISGKCHLERLRGDGIPSKITALSDMTDKATSRGWEIEPEGSDPYPEELKPAFDALGLTGEGKDEYDTYTADQDLPFKNNIQPDVQQAATQAGLTNNYNILSKTIIANFNYGVRFRLDEKKRPTGPQYYPYVNAWSDVVWLQWQKLAGGEAGDLHYIVRYHVKTDSTKRVIEQATGSEVDMFDSPWPGKEFDMNTDEGQALLGTAHGGGVAWLLVNHRNTITKQIAKVSVFTTGGTTTPDYHMIWTLE